MARNNPTRKNSKSFLAGRGWEELKKKFIAQMYKFLAKRFQFLAMARKMSF